MDIKKKLPDLEAPLPPLVSGHVLYCTSPTTRESHTKRWAWVCRFILSLAALAFVMHCMSSNRLPQLWQSYSKENAGKKEHLVLHTGFPAIGVEPNGLSILPNQGAAIAFSPNTAGSSSLLPNNNDGNVNVQKESWWDRLFPWRHVHLHSVQLPVHSSKPIKARLAVCTSTRDSTTLWQNIPDASQCVASATPLTVLDPQDDPGVLEWIAPTPNNAAVANDAIVLRKKNVYWLVVQTEQDEFDWVYALPSEDYIGDSRVAYETQNGWKLEQTDYIPSIMVTVVDH